jgi:signal transduction histidine kinase
VLGQGRLPEPTACTPDDVLGGRYNRQWVEVEGVVLQVKYAAGYLWIQLAGKGGWGMANVYHWPAEPLGDTWWGAKVKIRGLNIGKGQNAFRVHSPELVTVLEPGRAWPFDLPETPMAELAALTEPKPDRVKIRATILGVQGSVVFLRSGGIALQADLMYPFDSIQEPSGRFLDAPKIPWLDRGDEMDVVGSPLQVQPYVRLQLAQFKVVKRLAGVVPKSVTVEDAASGRAGNDLVTVRGRLTSRHETGAGPLRRETLELTVGQQAMPVILDTRTGGLLKHLALNDLVEATGIVEPAPGTPPWVVRMTEAKDVTSFGLAPEVASARRWKALAWLAGGLLLVGGITTVTRRRQLRQRERVSAIREQNAALEKRVAERTAELEVAQEDLKRALEQERELGELKSRFVSTVSHEFRTPLGIIMSAVELLQNYSDRLPEEQRAELMNDVRNSTLRMSSMMEQVLVLGRAEAGKLEFRVAPLAVHAVVERLISECLLATHAACPIQWEPSGDLSGAAGDEGLVRHILTNLLSNAVKYSTPGSEVRLQAKREGGELVLTVQDQGIGIPLEDQSGIFEAFHRGTNVGERPGTGLGLVIVQRCVQLHGGTIGIESKVGEGSTFTVRLPLFEMG